MLKRETSGAPPDYSRRCNSGLGFRKLPCCAFCVLRTSSSARRTGRTGGRLPSWPGSYSTPCRNFGSYFLRSRRIHLHRIVLTQPSFNNFPLGGQQNTLPAGDSSSLVILRHQVRSFVINLDQVGGGPTKLEGRQGGLMFLHVIV